MWNNEAMILDSSIFLSCDYISFDTNFISFEVINISFDVIVNSFDVHMSTAFPVNIIFRCWYQISVFLDILLLERGRLRILRSVDQPKGPQNV